MNSYISSKNNVRWLLKYIGNIWERSPLWPILAIAYSAFDSKKIAFGIYPIIFYHLIQKQNIPSSGKILFHYFIFVLQKTVSSAKD